jgi:DNA-binding transcriptional LysR family regulator
VKANLEIRHCRALIAVADQGGIARAAESLGIAQSTLSETLISLERAVGTRMVLRQRGVEARLTFAADILLPHARRIAAAADAATAMVAAEANILRVGAVESISSYVLPSAIRAVRSSHPETRLQVTVGLCADLQSQVNTGRLDVAMLLRGGQSPSTGDLVVRRLGTSQLRLVVKSDGPLAGRRLDPAELARLGVVVPDPHGPLNDLLEGWLKAHGAKGRLISAGSLDAVKRSILLDGAVGVLPAYVTDREIAAGAFAEVSLGVDLPGLALDAVMVPPTARFAALEALICGMSLEVQSLTALKTAG